MAPGPEVPKCDDGTGYLITAADLDFLGVATDDLQDMLDGNRPLGMTATGYSWFVAELEAALQRDGIDDADVRLQGSSAHLWSGWHKTMPFDRSHLFQVLSEIHDGSAEVPTIDHCSNTLEQQWPDPSSRPTRRPFDVMFRAQIDPVPSDYDVQISSDQMIELLRLDFERRGVDMAQVTVHNSKYHFIEKRYLRDVFLYLHHWSVRASKELGRPVSWAVFPSSGPIKDESDEIKSSHFKPTDWKILVGS